MRRHLVCPGLRPGGVEQRPVVGVVKGERVPEALRAQGVSPGQRDEVERREPLGRERGDELRGVGVLGREDSA